MEYTIGEFSKLTNLGIHTLHYYEHEGLLTPERNSGNRRRYSEKDLVWVMFIKRLKDTGMPIKQIQHYAKLRAAGDSTLPDRMELLAAHKNTLCMQIRQLQENMEKLDSKIEFYRMEIERIAKK